MGAMAKVLFDGAVLHHPARSSKKRLDSLDTYLTRDKRSLVLMQQDSITFLAALACKDDEGMLG